MYFIQLQRAYVAWQADIRDTNAERDFLIGGGHATEETVEEVIAQARANVRAIREEMTTGLDPAQVLPIVTPHGLM